MKKVKVVYFESGDICEFRCGRASDSLAAGLVKK